METAKVLLPFVNRDVRSSAVQDATAQSSFLFVNGTASSPAFKNGGRQDIRSHVRKHIAKRFRQNHKGSKALGKGDDEVTQYPLIAPQSFSNSDYTHTQDCRHDEKPLLSASQASLERPWMVPTATNHTKPKDFSASVPSWDPPSGSAQSEVNSMSQANTVYNIPSSNIPGEGTLQDEQRSFCPVCGSYISSTKSEEIERRGAVALARRISRRPFVNHGPIESLASGRVDPFLCYPVEKPTPELHELIDHGM